MSSLTTSGQPIRSTLRTTGVIGLALGLTSGVLVLVANVVDTWA
jgi:tetrahydromethanopterin S-methyltransferase subunit F